MCAWTPKNFDTYLGLGSENVLCGCMSVSIGLFVLVVVFKNGSALYGCDGAVRESIVERRIWPILGCGQTAETIVGLTDETGNTASNFLVKINKLCLFVFLSWSDSFESRQRKP